MLSFRLTRLTLFYDPEPTDFIVKFVYTEMKGQCKTDTTELGLQKCRSLNNFDETLWKRVKINISTNVLMK